MEGLCLAILLSTQWALNLKTCVILQLKEIFFYYVVDYFPSSLSLFFPSEVPIIRWMLELISAFNSLCLLCCVLEELHSSISLITNLIFSCVYFANQSIYVETVNIIIEIKTQRFLTNPFIIVMSCPLSSL